MASQAFWLGVAWPRGRPGGGANSVLWEGILWLEVLLLELELGSNGGSKEEEEIREEGESRCGEWTGEASGGLSPALPARGGGQAGAQVRGRAGGGGGHLLLPTGAREGTSQGWAGPGLGVR
ncbi:hypothetical protein ZWY2020_028087 [Hordeum vulgare]|nr:hypothetical protein ZWY2020_028087 [Hordeum vulgare]